MVEGGSKNPDLFTGFQWSLLRSLLMAFKIACAVHSRSGRPARYPPPHLHMSHFSSCPPPPSLSNRSTTPLIDTWTNGPDCGNNFFHNDDYGYDYDVNPPILSPQYEKVQGGSINLLTPSSKDASRTSDILLKIPILTAYGEDNRHAGGGGDSRERHWGGV